MVVGDIVNGISADNTILDHQPAVGVEEIVTLFALDRQAGSYGFFNGTIESNCRTDGTLGGIQDLTNIKMGITNTLRLRCFALGAGNFSAFSAIQIQ